MRASRPSTNGSMINRIAGWSIRPVYTLTDLFAGAGGFTLGFKQAGLLPAYAVEIDKDAAATYEANFGAHCSTQDINLVKKFPSSDVIIGGPPCQGFSNLGAHIPNDPRNQLWRHFVRAVKQINPLIFVVENVPPLLNSADFGAPQARKRTVIIGSRIGPVDFPVQTHIDPKRKDLAIQQKAINKLKVQKEVRVQ